MIAPIRFGNTTPPFYLSPENRAIAFNNFTWASNNAKSAATLTKHGSYEDFTARALVQLATGMLMLTGVTQSFPKEYKETFNKFVKV